MKSTTVGFGYELETLTPLKSNLCFRSQNVYDPYQPFRTKTQTEIEILLVAQDFDWQLYFKAITYESIQFIFRVNTF